MDVMSTIKQDIQEAVKKRNRSLANTLKYLYSLLQTEKARNNQFDENKAIKVIQKEMKAKKEALKMFEEAERENLVENEREEMRVLKNYLPKMMSRQQIEEEVEKVIGEMKEIDFGQVMGKVMANVKGKADGKLVAQVVGEKINENSN
jgi:uncharacterized protein YqeY